MSADEWEVKGDRLFDLNRTEEAKKCWNEAERLRVEEKQHSEKIST